jgi:hypothetical protein
VDFGSIQDRIIWTLYYLRIHSLEELAKTPASKLRLRNRIGRKSLECILAVLESRGLPPARIGTWQGMQGCPLVPLREYPGRFPGNKRNREERKNP